MSSDSEPIIIDEWLWSDLSEENGKQNREEAFEFLECLYKKCDKIATIRGSKYEKKFFDLCKHTDNISRAIIRFYKGYILDNSEKYITINEEECDQLSEDISPKINIDDQYLIKLYFKLQCTIVTTDKRLLGTLKEHNIKCEDRDIFLPEYIKKYNK
jgi:hypothetical protein